VSRPLVSDRCEGEVNRVVELTLKAVAIGRGQSCVDVVSEPRRIQAGRDANQASKCTIVRRDCIHELPLSLPRFRKARPVDIEHDVEQRDRADIRLENRLQWASDRSYIG